MLQAQRQQLVQARVGLQEQQAVVQKQVQQLQMHHAAQQSAAAAASQGQISGTPTVTPAAAPLVPQQTQPLGQQQKPGNT